ncbi:MAG TPA: hypothetical protein VGM92_11610 [Candidatus Kapabacteria bacterium]|jgi:hypothetical protein
MTQFNPLSGSILQSGAIQQQAAAEKTAQLRRTQQLEKDAALEDDEMEHQVESSEEVTPVDDGNDKHGENPRQYKKKPYQGDDGHEHVDLTA